MDPTRWPLALCSSAPAVMKAVIGLLIATTLVTSSGCAKRDWIDRTLVTEDVTGTWAGRISGSAGTGREVVFELEQQGSMVKGAVRFIGGGVSGGLAANRSQPGPIEGTMSGDVFRFRDPRSNLEGELKVSGDEMNGLADIGTGSSPLSLRRADPSPLPGSPPR